MAPNKFLAKIASGWKKPDGLTVIAPERVETFLQGLPVDALWGVGPVTADAAARARHRQADRRARESRGARKPSSAVSPTWLIELAHGRDDRAGGAEPAVEVGGIRRDLRPRISSVHARSATRSTSMARDVAAWLEKKADQGTDRDDQSALLGFHDDHAQPESRATPTTPTDRDESGEPARQDRGRHAPGAIARRERAQLRPGPRRRGRRPQRHRGTETAFRLAVPSGALSYVIGP